MPTLTLPRKELMKHVRIYNLQLCSDVIIKVQTSRAFMETYIKDGMYRRTMFEGEYPVPGFKYRTDMPSLERGIKSVGTASHVVIKQVGDAIQIGNRPPGIVWAHTKQKEKWVGRVELPLKVLAGLLKSVVKREREYRLAVQIRKEGYRYQSHAGGKDWLISRFRYHKNSDANFEFNFAYHEARRLRDFCNRAKVKRYGDTVKIKYNSSFLFAQVGPEVIRICLFWELHSGFEQMKSEVKRDSIDVIAVSFADLKRAIPKNLQNIDGVYVNRREIYVCIPHRHASGMCEEFRLPAPAMFEAFRLFRGEEGHIFVKRNTVLVEGSGVKMCIRKLEERQECKRVEEAYTLTELRRLKRI